LKQTSLNIHDEISNIFVLNNLRFASTFYDMMDRILLLIATTGKL